MTTRTETDSMGPIEVGADKCWGAQTEPNTHQPIISREEFAEAARMRRARETNRHCRELLIGRGRTNNFLVSPPFLASGWKASGTKKTPEF